MDRVKEDVRRSFLALAGILIVPVLICICSLLWVAVLGG